MPRILVIGDLIRDVDVHGSCSRFAAEAAGCPVFAEERRESRNGGAGAVALMAQGLGARVGIITGPNDSAKYRHFADGRQVWRHDIDAEPLTATEVAELADEVCQEIRNHDWSVLLIADYGKGVCQYAVVRAAIDGAAARHVPCLVDPARGVDWRTYRGATCIKCNALEWAAAGTLSHSEHVVRTDGARGLTHFHRGESIDYPARPSKLVDVTGAGDMVLAALGVGLARGLSWPAACRAANEAAGLKVERHGAR